jgi:SAM-dependent methyltransferase
MGLATAGPATGLVVATGDPVKGCLHRRRGQVGTASSIGQTARENSIGLAMRSVLVLEEPTPYELPDERVSQAWSRLISDYLVGEPLEPTFAARLAAEGVRIFAELGAGAAPIGNLLRARGVRCVALDLTPPADRPRHLIRGDLRHLPFARSSFDAVSAVNCLYFLASPAEAIEEAKETLKPGGLFLASTPSRYHDPELADVFPGRGTPSSFDAEEASELVSSVFGEVEAEWWEGPAYRLADRSAVIDYLVGFGCPDPEKVAELVDPPVTITKSGVNVWARSR